MDTEFVMLKEGWSTLHHSPSPARCVGEGGRRPDEGSFAQWALISMSIPCWTKEPSPALRAPSPIASQRERGKFGGEVCHG
jgi:hypothetical protein